VTTPSDERGPDDPHLKAALDPRVFRAQGHALVDQLAAYLAEAEAGKLPVIEWHPPNELAAMWPIAVSPEPQPADFLPELLAHAVHQHHPRCVGHQVAAVWPQAALSELVVGLLNNGMAAYESGPVSSALEHNLIAWLASRAGMAPEADGVLTSGGTLGTLTGLLAARQHAEAHDDAAGSRQPMAVLASAHSHYAVSRAVTVMGWGRDGVVPVAVDARFRMDVGAAAAALARARRAGRTVVGLVATASTSVTGAYDPLEPLAELCAREGLWLHVDGAHGASALMSRKYRERMRGVEEADSLVWDAHKLLGLPALVTAVLFRDGRSSFAPFEEDASYLYREEEAPGRWYDYGIRNLECTKRMMSVSLYLALRQLGTDLLDRVITSRFDLALDFAAAIAEAPDFELATEPEGNIVCFRYAPGGAPADDREQDRRREAVNRSGEFYFTRSVLDGRTWLRVTLMHPRTEASDLEALLAAIRSA